MAFEKFKFRQPRYIQKDSRTDRRIEGQINRRIDEQTYDGRTERLKDIYTKAPTT